MASAKRLVKIDVVSDNICPWCFVGKRRLEKAIAQVSLKPPPLPELFLRFPRQEILTHTIDKGQTKEPPIGFPGQF